MSDLRELYQQVIIEHSRSPRNYKELEHPSHSAEGYNPLCGDQITVYLVVEGDRVVDVSFKGSGCAISKASASLMTAAVKGKTISEAEEKQVPGCLRQMDCKKDDFSTASSETASFEVAGDGRAASGVELSHRSLETSRAFENRDDHRFLAAGGCEGGKGDLSNHEPSVVNVASVN